METKTDEDKKLLNSLVKNMVDGGHDTLLGQRRSRVSSLDRITEESKSNEMPLINHPEQH